ncbi:MAG: hypothetical protein ALECFALPRED_009151 [Alectoria fallacina]|uniref:Uncharacterized protein n=1 Tax=Alectoria fallacina TaxID=1903189 RepID=A0A8H3PJ22_9LECA|nr:MAG: hypothetical protein ALECFALPRED_009151 [Alectoria fallacina]
MSILQCLLCFPPLASVLSSRTTASPLSTRSTTYYGLIFAPNSGCTPSQTTAVLDGITDMRTLCTSAIAALEPPSNSLSSYFFAPSHFATASAIFNATLFSTQPLQDLPTSASLGYNQIQLSCANDTDATCNTLSPGDNSVHDSSSKTTTWGYIGANPVFGSGNGAAQIYACPALLNGTLPRNAPSCTGTPGLATLGWAFLRTFVQLKTFQTVPKLATWDTIADNAPGVEQSHELVENGSGQDGLNADNFAELAVWAQSLGASGNAEQPFQCPQNLPFR